jgi:outer membrane cobalamin receptor
VEALRGVRGVFVGNDTSYASVGFRGFAPPGDYGNHVLVLVDGQPTNDNYVGSSYVGYDGRADIADIQRIEVVRGPGSALYGTGAFFGVINLVTRDRTAPTHGEAEISTADAGVGHARATAQVRVSPDAGFWVSAAGAHGVGRDFFFQEYASDPATQGNARGVDGFDTGTVNGRAWWKDLTVQWLFTSRKKTLPSGEYQTVFGDPRNRLDDTRGLVEVRYEPHVSKDLQLLSRAHYNYYGFDDFLAYTPENGGNLMEDFRGQWAGFEERAIWSPYKALRLTVGGEAQDHFETQQRSNTPTTGNYLNQNNPYTVLAGYGVVDLEPEPWIKASLGGRVDDYSTFGTSYNPRGAIILRPYKGGNLKIMGGSAFRAPSVYEHYYFGPTQVPGGNQLHPETVRSGEVEFTHTFSNTVSATIAGYYNRVEHLIELVGDGTTTMPNQYQNSNTPVQTVGGEFEVRREWRNGWMVAANYAYQHSAYENATQNLRREVPNSPNHLGSVKGAAPIVGSFLTAMTRLSFQGPRFDRNDKFTDPPQLQTSSAVIWDVVLSGQAERYGIRYALGLYNAMDYRYSVPISHEFTQDTMVQPGRTVLLSSQVTF